MIVYVPNIITISRIVLSFTLLLMEPLSMGFFSIYLLCGFSDVIDGYLARKSHGCSSLGATLDSIADAIFIGVLFVILIPLLQWPVWILYWIGLIAGIRFLSLLVGVVKYRAIAFLHTYGNKLTGLLLFCFPLLYKSIGLASAAVLICSIATLTALEELLINALSKELVRDVRSISKRHV